MTSAWDLEGLPAERPASSGRTPRDTGRRRGRAGRWLLGGLLVVAVAGGLGAWWYTTRGPSAEDVAEEYLTALRDGNVAALQRLTGTATARDGGDGALEAFAQATDYLSEATLDAVEVRGDRATLRATVTLAGETSQIETELERVDGAWTVPHRTTLTARADVATAVAIGPVTLAVGDPQPLFPALYELTAEPAEILSGNATVPILPGEDRQEVRVEAEVADGAQEVVQEHIAAHAADCAARTDGIPEACGIVVPWAADLRELGSVEFTAERVPRVELDTDEMTFAATGGTLIATVTGTAHDGSEQTFTYRTEDWSMRGTLAFEGSRLVLSVF